MIDENTLVVKGTVFRVSFDACGSFAMWDPTTLPPEQIDPVEKPAHCAPQGTGDCRYYDFHGDREPVYDELEVDPVGTVSFVVRSKSFRVGGKGQRDRVVPLAGAACDATAEYLRQCRQPFWRNPREEALFLTWQGRRLSPITIPFILQRQARQAGLDVKVSPHMLRHACATHLLKNGASIRHIQRLLGHAETARPREHSHDDGLHGRAGRGRQGDGPPLSSSGAKIATFLMKSKLIFSTHALRRMLRHRILSKQVREVLERGERIEEYPDDEPLPSYLMLGEAGCMIHVVAADGVENDETIVITTYEPDPVVWEVDLKTRREP